MRLTSGRVARWFGALFFSPALVVAARPAAAHGVHDNATYLESGILHAIMTPHLLALILAMGTALAWLLARRDRGNRYPFAERLPGWVTLSFIIALSAAAGGAGALLLPEGWLLEGYGLWPLVGLLVAAALFFFLGRIGALALIATAVLGGALLTLAAYLDGPAERNWMWFLAGLTMAAAVIVILLATLVGWFRPRWLETAARIAGAWCPCGAGSAGRPLAGAAADLTGRPWPTDTDLANRAVPGIVAIMRRSGLQWRWAPRVRPGDARSEA